MMHLYAIRDRLIDYYLQPFCGQNDKAITAALAETINGERSHAIQQAPHHFELYKLADIDEETGAVTPNKVFVADCASLVRDIVRTTRTTGTDTPALPTGRRADSPGRSDKPDHADAGALQADTPATPGERTGTHQEPRRSLTGSLPHSSR